MDDSAQRLKPFVKQLGINYPVLLAVDHGDRLEQAIGGVWALPTTYILGRDGRVVKTHVGLASQAELRQWIEKALGPGH